MINIAHNDRNVFVTNIIDVGTFRTVKNCSALNPYQNALVSVCCRADGCWPARKRSRLPQTPTMARLLAQRWCTGCHVVSGDQIRGPTFSIICIDSGKTRFQCVKKVASFLLEPHLKMPNMALSPEEAKDIGLHCRTATQIGRVSARDCSMPREVITEPSPQLACIDACCGTRPRSPSVYWRLADLRSVAW